MGKFGFDPVDGAALAQDVNRKNHSRNNFARAQSALTPVTNTDLPRELKPASTSIALRAIPRTVAKNRIKAALAWPSTGGALIFILRESP